MDIDQFLARHGGSWTRLEELTKRAGHNARHLSTSELDELIRLYQRTSAHLSYASTNFRDPGLAMRLSRLVSQSGAVVYGTRPRTWRSFGRFFRDTLPAALWYSRRFLLASAALTFLPALAFAGELTEGDRRHRPRCGTAGPHRPRLHRLLPLGPLGRVRHPRVHQ
jgi:hypothetical protein